MGVRSLGNSLSSFGYKFGRTGLEAAGAPPPGFMSATGGIISDYEVSGTHYRAHIFNSPGTFVSNGNASIDYLLVGGGGGGGFGRGDDGGGGGGGARTRSGGRVSFGGGLGDHALDVLGDREAQPVPSSSVSSLRVGARG